jgi:hypothetical protein
MAHPRLHERWTGYWQFRVVLAPSRHELSVRRVSVRMEVVLEGLWPNGLHGFEAMLFDKEWPTAAKPYDQDKGKTIFKGALLKRQ